jgi:hypothetical protein
VAACRSAFLGWGPSAAPYGDRRVKRLGNDVAFSGQSAPSKSEACTGGMPGRDGLRGLQRGDPLLELQRAAHAARTCLIKGRPAPTASALENTRINRLPAASNACRDACRTCMRQRRRVVRALGIRLLVGLAYGSGSGPARLGRGVEVLAREPAAHRRDGCGSLMARLRRGAVRGVAREGIAASCCSWPSTALRSERRCSRCAPARTCAISPLRWKPYSTRVTDSA